MNQSNQHDPALKSGGVLVVVDVQNDVLPGGSLAVPGGDEIVPVIKRYIELFHSNGLPVYATRDWHPKNHCLFEEQGVIWPVHCVAGTTGSRFPSNRRLTDSATVISKAVEGTQTPIQALRGQT